MKKKAREYLVAYVYKGGTGRWFFIAAGWAYPTKKMILQIEERILKENPDMGVVAVTNIVDLGPADDASIAAARADAERGRKRNEEAKR